jgi:hypothetical protein
MGGAVGVVEECAEEAAEGAVAVVVAAPRGVACGGGCGSIALVDFRRRSEGERGHMLLLLLLVLL